jgi:RimJ/RimL family protein N-acetyltransferase
MVRVEAMRREWADALADGDAVFSERFGVAVVAGWPGFPEALPRILSTARRGRPDAWGPHLFFDDDGALVGLGGWKGPPVDGAAELGYAVAPARQRRGIASAAVRVLVGRARLCGVRMVVAHTLAEESGSTRVLERSGFTKAGELLDADVGPVWRWELQLDGEKQV